MKIGNLNIDGHLFSAPLAGISDSVFRRICRRYGASATVSEMISARGLSHGNHKTMDYLHIDDEERPVGIQLFTGDPDSALEGLKIALNARPDFIDFNLGCPVKKVIKQGSGGALLKDPHLAVKILKIMVDNSPIPVTAKMRSGWDSDSFVFLDLAKRLQDIGVAAIFIHPRTVMQGFSGKPDRDIVAEAVSTLDIPVIYSGDIRSIKDAAEALKSTGSDGIMVGRAAMGDPHIFARLKHYFRTGEIMPEPTPSSKIDMLIDFYRFNVEQGGGNMENRVKTMRKFVVWYTRGLPGNSPVRQKIFRLTEYDRVMAMLRGYQRSLAAKNTAKTV